MNNLEDKELQELFAAKRLSEENIRRREAIKSALEAEEGRSRRLWPIWFGAVAAAVALIFIGGMFLFRSSDVAPELTAQNIPAVVEEPALSLPAESLPALVVDAEEERPLPSAAVAPRRVAKRNVSPMEVLPEHVQSELSSDVAEKEASPAVEEQPVPRRVDCAKPLKLESKKIVRRSSTLLACTDGCVSPTPKDDAEQRKILFFNSEKKDVSNVLYAIVIK